MTGQRSTAQRNHASTAHHTHLSTLTPCPPPPPSLSSQDGIYDKWLNIYKGLVGPNAPGAAEKAAKALENKEGGGAAARPSTAPADLNSASAAELKSTIQRQEAELARQQKMIEDLQRQVSG